MTFLQFCGRARFDDPGSRFALDFCADRDRPRAPDGSVNEWRAREAYRGAVVEWAKARELRRQFVLCWNAWQGKRWENAPVLSDRVQEGRQPRRGIARRERGRGGAVRRERSKLMRTPLKRGTERGRVER